MPSVLPASGHNSKDPLEGGGLPGSSVLTHQHDPAVGHPRTCPCRFLKQPDWAVSSIDPSPKQGCHFLAVFHARPGGWVKTPNCE